MRLLLQKARLWNIATSSYSQLWERINASSRWNRRASFQRSKYLESALHPGSSLGYKIEKRLYNFEQIKYWRCNLKVNFGGKLDAEQWRHAFHKIYQYGHWHCWERRNGQIFWLEQRQLWITKLRRQNWKEKSEGIHGSDAV